MPTPTRTTYPGVYIEEAPSAVRPIAGVATSVTAFLGSVSRGPVNEATRVLSWGDFERECGGRNADSELAYQVEQFFQNGGTEAWIVRVAGAGAASATAVADDDVGGSARLTMAASSTGTWGNNLRARIDPTPGQTSRFDLTVTEYTTTNGREEAVRTEIFSNLAMSGDRLADTIVNDDSALVQVTAAGATLPMFVGTQSGLHEDANGDQTTIDLRTTADPPGVMVTLGSVSAYAGFTARPTLELSLAQVATLLEEAIRAARPDLRPFAQATVRVVGNRLRVVAGPGGDPRDRLQFAVVPAPTAPDTTPVEDATTLGLLKLDAASALMNLQEYVLGETDAVAVADTAQGTPDGSEAGNDGAAIGQTELIGSENQKTGIYALEDVDLFNLLCIPRCAQVSGTNALSTTAANAVLTAAETYCERRRAVLLVDTWSGVDDISSMEQWIDDNSGLRNANAAVFFPRVAIADPLADGRLRTIGASGTIAGLIARTDSARGLWKSPAGTEAKLRNVQALEYVMTDGENGVLNPLGINCLRSRPVVGLVNWGARTLVGSDLEASQWKYLSVRRMALYIEESLYRGTQWVVFEPNDEPLWAQIRLNVGAFMQGLFRQGAFQGASPRDAYFVKCDSETTTQDDINQGRVNVLVGFAPLKPAEFVVIRISQINQNPT